MILSILIITFVLGFISNEIGGIIGFNFNFKKYSIRRAICFTAGITTAIICFEILYEAFKLSNKYNVILFVIIGIVFVKILNYVINNIFKEKDNHSKLIVSSMSAHNITEGIAIGSALGVSKNVGLSILIAIMIHNIPEGMIIGTAIKKENGNNKNVLKNCMLIGIFLAIGAVIGYKIENVETYCAMQALAISAGAMLYIVAYELIPEINDSDNKTSLNYIIGFIIGCLMCTL